MADQASIPPSVLPAQSFAHPGQAKPMIKMVSKMLKARLGKGTRKKGLTTGDVQIKHKKIKYY